MGALENIDWNLLLFINSGHTPFWDSFFMTITNKLTWIPLYIVLFALFIWKLGWKNTMIVVGGALVCFFLTEMVSSKIFKVYFTRLRPCHTMNGTMNLWLPKGCGGLYGFLSSHAANTMGLAFYSILVFMKIIKAKWSIIAVILLLIYSLLNGLSRIYLGVHYPSDVIAGFALGMIFAYVLFRIVKRFTIPTN